MLNHRKQLRVLIVSLKWTDARPGRPLSSAYIFINTLQRSGLGTPLSFFCDEHIHRERTQCDEALMRLCAKQRPDMLFLLPSQLDVTISLNGGGAPTQSFYLFPRNETLRWIRKSMGIPIVNAIGDAYGSEAFHRFQEMADFSDIMLLFEPESDFLTWGPSAKYRVLWCPVPQGLYFSHQEARDIPISFIGRTYLARHGENLPPENPLHQYAYRERFLQKMISLGIPVFRAGGADSFFILSAELVAQYFRQSRIALNLTYQSPTKHLIRGRSWEALNCGAMLLEEDNASIRHFLEPMKHYVPFSSMEDAVHKSRYFMAHDAERNAIAQAGNRVAAEQYSESAFWSKCFRLIYA